MMETPGTTDSPAALTGSCAPRSPHSVNLGKLTENGNLAKDARDTLIEIAKDTARAVAARLDPGDGLTLPNGATYRVLRLSWTIVRDDIERVHGDVASVLTRNGYALHDERRPKAGFTLTPRRGYTGEYGITPVPFASRDGLLAFLRDVPELIEGLEGYLQARTRDYEELAAQTYEQLAILRNMPEVAPLASIPNADPERLRRIALYQQAASALQQDDLYAPIGSFRIPPQTRIHLSPANGQETGAWAWAALWIPRCDVDAIGGVAHNAKRSA